MHFKKTDLEKEHINNLLNVEYLTYNLSPFRFWYRHFLKYHNKIKGDLIELGVFNGRSLLTMALLLKKMKSKKVIYGFDTFSGFPSISTEDHLQNFSNRKYFSKSHLIESKKNERLKRLFSDEKINVLNISSSKNFSTSSLEILKKKIKLFNLDNIKFIKGDICKTLPKFFEKNPKIRVFSCNFDVDLYMPYKVGLPLVWRKLSKRGFIHLDEYYSLKFAGPKIATDDFLKKNNIQVKKNKTRKNEFKRFYLQK